MAIILKKPVSKAVRELTELAASPIPYFFLLTGAPFNIAMPLLLITILGLATRAVWRSRQFT